MTEYILLFFFFQEEDGIRYRTVTGVQTCALPISSSAGPRIVGSSTPPARRSRGSAISVSTSRHRRAEHETLVAGPDAGACGPSLAVAPARLILALDPRPIARLSLPRPRRSVARGDEERGGGRGWHALRGRGLGEIEQAVRLSRRCSSSRPTS